MAIPTPRHPQPTAGGRMARASTKGRVAWRCVRPSRKEEPHVRLFQLAVSNMPNLVEEILFLL